MAPPEVDPQIKARGRDVHWYKADIGEISEPARRLFENYSRIPPDAVVPHIAEIRDRAWNIFPYPCIGQCRFLDLSISLSPLYPTILRRLKESNHLLLDLGCCFAQDIRKLVSDGAPSENVFGADLRPEFVDLGYDLFRDRDTLKSRFLIGDIFDETTGSTFREFDGKVDIIYAASFFHLFNWEDQVGMTERVVRLLKPVEGSLILGRQRGNVNSGEYEHRTNSKATMFRHNEESWKEMWKQVGKATGSLWDVKVWLEKDEDFGRYGKNDGNIKLDLGDRGLRFEVSRI
ncbi:hypothetical protein HO133_006647 [Letharia lupina]|uniref:Methyltransferase domain-containing protein n=1 Tax=Letharia lupina TaxID=560253 RepID=A0A8H6F734_9LECA|nr:uncharacterized protein HO133_006647 [Letharia lupina]KAF6217820.1 hypothetical protein HO133_006647 [Letharia lupina]